MMNTPPNCMKAMYEGDVSAVMISFPINNG